MARARTNHNSPTQLKDLMRDLETLRDDFGKLTKHMERLANDTGGDVLDDVKGRLNSFATTVDGLITNIGDRGSAAINGIDTLRENITQNVEETVRERPLTTVAIALGVGFMLSSAMRR